MNWFKKTEPLTKELTEPLTKEPIVIKTVRGDSVLYRMVTEADIRKEAYLLWEKNGKVRSSEKYWYEAEQKIRKALLDQK